MKKIQLKPAARKLLRMVKTKIRKTPEAFDMATFVAKKTVKGGYLYTDQIFLTGELIPPCNTSACIAGWALMLDGMTPRKLDKVNAFDEAAQRLGLEYDEENHERSEAARVFYENRWPKQLKVYQKKEVMMR